MTKSPYLIALSFFLVSVQTVAAQPETPPILETLHPAAQEIQQTDPAFQRR